MKTRGFQLHPDHVMALNLIPADFNDNVDVLTKFRAYIDHLYRPQPTDSGEAVRFSDERELIFGRLLVSIGKSLSVNLESDEVRHFRYAPMGWTSNEIEQQHTRKLLISVLQGITPISIRNLTDQPRLPPGPPGLFPHPPTPDGM